MSIRVGFASRDGHKVDECFLSSSDWWIYDIDKEDVRFVGIRNNKSPCDDQCYTCLSQIRDELDDCDLVFVGDINDNAMATARSIGFHLLKSPSTVKSILGRLAMAVNRNLSRDYYYRVMQYNTYG
ncbi:MAG: NifB/NifX family molybdenum-iron cluster-binding protein [Lachnospiraceae bacterium]|nr:NifB/NifX family molybdenum-iron cluster-binding protein [Lachnospiraceae bacterium]